MSNANIPQVPAHDPWVVQAGGKAEPLPPGMYMTNFQGVAPHALATGETRWRWAWTVKTGPLAGQEASALTECRLTPNTLSGRLVEGLIGRPLVAGDNVKVLVDATVGKPYMVSVQAGPQGGKPGVKSVSTPPQM